MATSKFVTRKATVQGKAMTLAMRKARAYKTGATTVTRSGRAVAR